MGTPYFGDYTPNEIQQSMKRDIAGNPLYNLDLYKEAEGLVEKPPIITTGGEPSFTPAINEATVKFNEQMKFSWGHFGMVAVTILGVLMGTYPIYKDIKEHYWPETVALPPSNNPTMYVHGSTGAVDEDYALCKSIYVFEYYQVLSNGTTKFFNVKEYTNNGFKFVFKQKL
jgi:hypothetical protein